MQPIPPQPPLSPSIRECASSLPSFPSQSCVFHAATDMCIHRLESLHKIRIDGSSLYQIQMDGSSLYKIQVDGSSLHHRTQSMRAACTRSRSTGAATEPLLSAPAAHPARQSNILHTLHHTCSSPSDAASSATAMPTSASAARATFAVRREDSSAAAALRRSSASCSSSCANCCSDAANRSSDDASCATHSRVRAQV
eukprot:54426-Chlamydomonas_euryale.AAC.3